MFRLFTPWRFDSLVLLGVLTLLSGGVSANPPARKRFAKTQPRMGTLVTVILYAEDADAAERALAATFARIDALDAILSDYRADSELSRLCAAAPHSKPVEVSRELGDVLVLARAMHKHSDGAFDVTVGPLSRLWRQARRRQEMPPRDLLETAIKSVGHQFVELAVPKEPTEKLRVRLNRAGMKLDLGGVAKGYIVDEALATLRAAGIRSALINAGGDLGMSAAPPDAKGWNVGVASVNTRGKPDRIIQLANAAVATSGDAFQAVTIDGVRYSHIIDPQTGLGLTRRSAVTVIAPDCAKADAWASALSVMGPKNGLAAFPKQTGFHARILTVGAKEKLELAETTAFPAGRAIEENPKPTKPKQP